MLIRFQNLSIEDDRYRKKLLKSINNFFDHGLMILGPEVLDFEKEISNEIR